MLYPGHGVTVLDVHCDAMVALNPGVTRFRLMRAQLRGMTGRIATSIEDLDWLLEQDPPDVDREVVQHMRRSLESRR